MIRDGKIAETKALGVRDISTGVAVDENTIFEAASLSKPVFAYAVLQLGRVWVVASLGRRWTTRIIVLPGATLVQSGPYRWLRHPNYAIVTAEIAMSGRT